ncbi:MAG: Eco57I restriction-modification methylase domain-containing protein [Bacteroidaceae bacterium]|nr:Eco57I restriction-modification methylase domain-containing protein [Bacteroidaceae bacterium]
MVNYKEVIESKYNREGWQRLLHDIFGSRVKFWNAPSVVPTSSQFSKQALWLGTITLSDERTISVYEVELSDSVDIERNRRGIRDMLLTAWRGNGNAGAFMFCYRKNESVLRFSYVSESWNFAEDGTYKKESTDTKRFTYLLGEGHRSRTAIQQFEKLRDSELSLKDLTKAFSVEAVSDMFFKGYKQQYEDIIFYVTGKRMVKVANKWEERQEGKPNQYIMRQFAHFANPEKAVRDYVKKLMGRLVFLQFLQKKGWLGVPANEPWGNGDAEFIQHLFEGCNDKDHFVDSVLETLFNDLNTERKGDNSQLFFRDYNRALAQERPRIFNYQFKVPYLNGGLFEREAADEAEFPLPAKYMQSLLDFFSSYNFTIDENDPDDAEVGVDPEMLGRIFENLLEDNKDKGAFYTPKEIVTYMCRESLIAYLQTGIEDEATKESLRQFVTTHNADTLGTNNKFRQQVVEALKDVKICDPAIGSGAFPMGLLKELFLCRTALEGIEQSKAAEIKKHIIQQNIYGVDIERGAVDIARLRFWLSLIVDEETPQALPNLDFKIMQGNSLLEQYEGYDLSTVTEKKDDGNLSLFDNMLDVYRKELRDKLSQYYQCTESKTKKQLKKEIVENVKKQLSEIGIEMEEGDPDLTGNNQFMLWHTWFYDVFSKGGFDIVIGNPPYIRRTSLSEKDKHNYEILYSSAKKQYDIYLLFIERGLKSLRSDGFLCYINPIKFFNSDYGKGCRKMIMRESCIKSIVDISQLSVFENAMTYPCVLLLERNNNQHNRVKYYRPDDISKVLNLNANDAITFDQTIFDSEDCNFIIPSDDKTIKVIGKIDKSKTFISTYYDVARGLANNKVDFDLEIYPAIKSKNVDKYCIKGDILYVDTEYAQRFSSEMVVLPRTVRYLKSAIKEKDLILLDRIYYLTPRYNTFIENQFVVGVINSKITNFWFEYKYSSTKVSGNYFDLNGNQIKSIPLPYNKRYKDAIISLVNKIIEKGGDKILEQEIDRIVYHLYGLTYDEVLIVDPNPPFTREEYEADSQQEENNKRRVLPRTMPPLEEDDDEDFLDEGDEDDEGEDDVESDGDNESEWHFVESVPFTKSSKYFLSHDCRVVLSELGYYLEVDDEYIKLGDYQDGFSSDRGNVWIKKPKDNRGYRMVHEVQDRTYLIGYIREEEDIITYTNPDGEEYTITFDDPQLLSTEQLTELAIEEARALDKAMKDTRS